MDFETLKPLFLVLFGIILSSFEPVWKLLQFLEFSIHFLLFKFFTIQNIFWNFFQQLKFPRIFQIFLTFWNSFEGVFLKIFKTFS